MDAIGRLDAAAPWESKENPQSYSLMTSYGENPYPTQHMLGIVGGNNAPYKNRQLQVELESDLRGITRPNTFCPQRQHQPEFMNKPSGQFALGQQKATIVRNVPKQKVTIPVVTTPLAQSQMWAYPATIAPEPFMIESCQQPHKY
jgi:hypothetical protein